ncbi:MAG: riboflavin biosynthesis protein RibD [Bacteroidia bacterium]|nr:MAG: riboflavin biosynthesis protein RibD [Bacteroidia bacterium]
MSFLEKDIFLLNRCFTLAEKSLNYTYPNPKVGALITNEQNEILSEGWHAVYGHAHAEVNAIQKLPQDFDFSRCTLYVSLEPCCHTQKKTPPCTSLIIEKKIPRVVIATLDPNPQVQSQGIQTLQQAGIEVVLYHEHFIQKQKALNFAFYVSQIYQRPYITLKWAESRNKIIGDSQKRIMISHPYTQFFSHALRAKHQALLVGKNTVLLDKPQLNLRYALGKDPLIILLDTHAEILPENFFPHREGIIINQKFHKQEGGWKYFLVEDIFSWKDYIGKLYNEYKIGSILVEGGSKVIENLLESGIWDTAYIIKTPQNILTEKPVIAPKNIQGSLQCLQSIQGNSIFKIENSQLL